MNKEEWEDYLKEVYDTIEYLIVKCIDLLDETNELKDKIDKLEKND